MRYSNIPSTQYTSAVCVECDKQFRHTNASLVRKLMDLHFKKNHPDDVLCEETDEILKYNLRVKGFNNTNTSQLSHTLYDKNGYGDTIKEIYKNK